LLHSNYIDLLASTATSKLYEGVVRRIDGCRCGMVGVDQIVFTVGLQIYR